MRGEAVGRREEGSCVASPDWEVFLARRLATLTLRVTNVPTSGISQFHTSKSASAFCKIFAETMYTHDRCKSFLHFFPRFPEKFAQFGNRLQAPKRQPANLQIFNVGHIPCQSIDESSQFTSFHLYYNCTNCTMKNTSTGVKILPPQSLRIMLNS